MASIVSRYLNWQRAEASRGNGLLIESRHAPDGQIVNGDYLLRQVGGITTSLAGNSITPETALATTAVYACVSLLAETVGSLPLKTYRRIDERVREPVAFGNTRARRLARLLGEVPNEEMNAQSFWETIVGHRALWGGAFVYVVRGDDGWPTELWPLHPGKIQVFREQIRSSTFNSPKFYMYTLPNGQVKKLPADVVMQVPGMSFDGFIGYSPVLAGRNAIGIEQAAAQYAAQFFNNSVTPSSIVTIPKDSEGGNPAIKQERFKARLQMYREAFEGFYGGLDRAQRLAVVEDGVTWEAAGMSNEQAQFLESRKFQIEEIARLFRIPLHMIAHTEKSTSWGTGIEQQSIGFLTYTLRPILSAITGAVSLSLGLVPGERTLRDDDIYCEFETKDLLKGDFKTQMEGFALLIQNRVLSPEDVAALLDMPFNPERPADYENPNTLTDEPVAEEDQRQFEQRTEQLAFALRQQLPPQLTVNANVEPSRTEILAPQPEVHVENPITVNVPEQQPPDVNVQVDAAPVPEVRVNVEAPIPRKTRKRVTRDDNGHIATIDEEDA